MKKTFLLTIILLIIGSCASIKPAKNVYISTLYKFGFVFTKDDSTKIKKWMAEGKAASENCQKFNQNCLLEPIMPQSTEFVGGINKFRGLVCENIRIPPHAKPSVYPVHIIVGRYNRIKSFEVENKNDPRVKREIERVLQLKELNAGNSM